ncbi:MAG: hypothetical protein LBT33_06085, partial [Spirochaetia bacterium]|nr:hypothetical protein [Spirochaetia bacterium]
MNHIKRIPARGGRERGKILFLCLGILFLALGCQSQTEEPEILPPGSFWAQSTTDNSWYVVRAGDALASSPHCEVYIAEDQQASLANAQIIA